MTESETEKTNKFLPDEVIAAWLAAAIVFGGWIVAAVIVQTFGVL